MNANASTQPAWTTSKPLEFGCDGNGPVVRAPVTRRELLVGTAAGTAGMLAMATVNRLALPESPVLSNTRAASTNSAPARAQLTLAALGIDHFIALVGELFSAEAGGSTATLVLRDVTVSELSAGTRPEELRSDGFSLLFEVTDGTLPESGIVIIEHGSIGRHGLFLHRVGHPDESAGRYEAVFN